VALLLMIGVIAIHMITSRTTARLSDNYGEALGAAASEHVRTELLTTQARVETMASAIASMKAAGRADRATVIKIVDDNMRATPSLIGGWFVATPDALDGQDAAMRNRPDLASGPAGVLNVYVVRDGDRIRLESTDIQDVYTSAYTETSARERRTALVDPYLYPIGEKMIAMTSISVPVVVEGRLIGVAGMDMPLTGINASMAKLRPFGDGRVMLVDRLGKWASHPDASLLTKAYAENGAQAVKTALATRTGATIEGVKDGQIAQSRRIVPAPLPEFGQNWAVVLDAPKATVNAPADQMARALSIGAVVIVTLVLGVLLWAAGVVVRQPLNGLVRSVERLGQGRYEEAVEGVDGGDGVGAVARALDGFRQDLAETQRLRNDQEQTRAATEQERLRNQALSDRHARRSGQGRQADRCGPFQAV